MLPLENDYSFGVLLAKGRLLSVQFERLGSLLPQLQTLKTNRPDS